VRTPVAYSARSAEGAGGRLSKPRPDLRARISFFLPNPNMTTLNHFNEQQKSFRLRMLQKNFDIAEIKGLAIQYALAEHSVTAFVKNLPIKSPLYPAIEYLRESKQSKIKKTINRDQEILHRDHEYIQWCMPAYDIKRPKDKVRFHKVKR
jgi:hypothetical protein